MSVALEAALVAVESTLVGLGVLKNLLARF
jgi:hypothetical protein